MKLLLENWRRYQTLNERINELGSGRRFVLDELVEITEEDNKTGLPEDQLEKIKKWAGLSGQAEFLGRGSRGSAPRAAWQLRTGPGPRNESTAATGCSEELVRGVQPARYLPEIVAQPRWTQARRVPRRVAVAGHPPLTFSVCLRALLEFLGSHPTTVGGRRLRLGGSLDDQRALASPRGIA